MEHFAPHPGSQFEGYYSKFDLPSGAHLAIIITTVPRAKHRPHLLSLTYVPKDGSAYFQREISIDELEMIETGPSKAFELRCPGIGSMVVQPDGLTVYNLKHKDFTFTAETFDHEPWSSRASTPESHLVHLPLPLHWHVHSLCSSCHFNLSIPSFPVQKDDASGACAVHQEKNWANSFPSAHIWIQARSSTHTICLAGGRILGLEAYLLGYRGPKGAELDFRPPLAVKALGLSPTLVAETDWARRRVRVVAKSWSRKIEVLARAEKGTFFPLSAPFPDGHRENMLAESFSAEIVVRVYWWKWGRRWWDVRGWWVGEAEPDEEVGRWELEQWTTFQNGSLEFGGNYYGFAGSKDRLGR